MKEQSELKPMNGLEQGLEMFCKVLFGYSEFARFFQKGITTTQTEPTHTETSPLSKSMTFYCALARFAYWGAMA